jgi:hypothetical protein
VGQKLQKLVKKTEGILGVNCLKVLILSTPTNLCLKKNLLNFFSNYIRIILEVTCT